MGAASGVSAGSRTGGTGKGPARAARPDLVVVPAGGEQREFTSAVFHFDDWPVAVGRH